MLIAIIVLVLWLIWGFGGFFAVAPGTGTARWGGYAGWYIPWIIAGFYGWHIYGAALNR